MMERALRCCFSLITTRCGYMYFAKLALAHWLRALFVHLWSPPAWLLGFLLQPLSQRIVETRFPWGGNIRLKRGTCSQLKMKADKICFVVRCCLKPPNFTWEEEILVQYCLEPEQTKAVLGAVYQLIHIGWRSCYCNTIESPTVGLFLGWHYCL